MYDKPRKMPPKEEVAAHVGLPLHECYRCHGSSLPTHRAHVIDRTYFEPDAPVEFVDGLGNLVPLCLPCHAGQPAFRPGQEKVAWAYMERDLETYVRGLLDMVWTSEEYDDPVVNKMKALLMVVSDDALDLAVRLIVDDKRQEMLWRDAA